MRESVSKNVGMTMYLGLKCVFINVVLNLIIVLKKEVMMMIFR